MSAQPEAPPPGEENLPTTGAPPPLLDPAPLMGDCQSGQTTELLGMTSSNLVCPDGAATLIVMASGTAYEDRHGATGDFSLLWTWTGESWQLVHDSRQGTGA